MPYYCLPPPRSTPLASRVQDGQSSDLKKINSDSLSFRRFRASLRVSSCEILSRCGNQVLNEGRVFQLHAWTKSATCDRELGSECY